MTAVELVDFMNTVPELGSTPMGKGPDVEEHHTIYSRREAELLARWALTTPPGAIAMEIGVYVGHTASILLNLERLLGLRVVLIDAWCWMMPDAKDSFDKMILENFLDSKFVGMWMSSREAHKLWTGEEIHFLHIDGNHDRSEDGVNMDCEMWLPHLAAGGVVGFHDVDHGPVMQTVEEYCPGWERERAGRTMVLRKPL